MPRKELHIPPAALDDDESFEILRAWISASRLCISVNVGVWDDPYNYGVLLSDLAQHMFDALNQSTGEPKEEIIGKINSFIENELKRES